MAVNVINPVALGPVKLEPGVCWVKNIQSMIGIHEVKYSITQ